jgi:hypothetical protein
MAGRRKFIFSSLVTVSGVIPIRVKMATYTATSARLMRVPPFTIEPGRVQRSS